MLKTSQTFDLGDCTWFNSLEIVYFDNLHMRIVGICIETSEIGFFSINSGNFTTSNIEKSFKTWCCTSSKQNSIVFLGHDDGTCTVVFDSGVTNKYKFFIDQGIVNINISVMNPTILPCMTLVGSDGVLCFVKEDILFAITHMFDDEFVEDNFEYFVLPRDMIAAKVFSVNIDHTLFMIVGSNFCLALFERKAKKIKKLLAKASRFFKRSKVPTIPELHLVSVFSDDSRLFIDVSMFNTVNHETNPYFLGLDNKGRLCIFTFTLIDHPGMHNYTSIQMSSIIKGQRNCLFDISTFPLFSVLNTRRSLLRVHSVFSDIQHECQSEGVLLRTMFCCEPVTAFSSRTTVLNENSLKSFVFGSKKEQSKDFELVKRHVNVVRVTEVEATNIVLEDDSGANIINIIHKYVSEDLEQDDNGVHHDQLHALITVIRQLATVDGVAKSFELAGVMQMCSVLGWLQKSLPLSSLSQVVAVSFDMLDNLKLDYYEVYTPNVLSVLEAFDFEGNNLQLCDVTCLDEEIVRWLCFPPILQELLPILSREKLKQLLFTLFKFNIPIHALSDEFIALCRKILTKNDFEVSGLYIDLPIETGVSMIILAKELNIQIDFSLNEVLSCISVISKITNAGFKNQLDEYCGVLRLNDLKVYPSGRLSAFHNICMYNKTDSWEFSKVLTDVDHFWLFWEACRRNELVLLKFLIESRGELSFFLCCLVYDFFLLKWLQNISNEDYQVLTDLVFIVVRNLQNPLLDSQPTLAVHLDPHLSLFASQVSFVPEVSALYELNMYGIMLYNIHRYGLYTIPIESCFPHDISLINQLNVVDLDSLSVALKDGSGTKPIEMVNNTSISGTASNEQIMFANRERFLVGLAQHTLDDALILSNRMQVTGSKILNTHVVELLKHQKAAEVIEILEEHTGTFENYVAFCNSMVFQLKNEVKKVLDANVSEADNVRLRASLPQNIFEWLNIPIKTNQILIPIIQLAKLLELVSGFIPTSQVTLMEQCEYLIYLIKSI
ncbi:hypothetical protein PCE1_002412 [Barthelona sp. PCE]